MYKRNQAYLNRNKSLPKGAKQPTNTDQGTCTHCTHSYVITHMHSSTSTHVHRRTHWRACNTITSMLNRPVMPRHHITTESQHATYHRTAHTAQPAYHISSKHLTNHVWCVCSQGRGLVGQHVRAHQTPARTAWLCVCASIKIPSSLALPTHAHAASRRPQSPKTPRRSQRKDQRCVHVHPHHCTPSSRHATPH